MRTTSLLLLMGLLLTFAACKQQSNTTETSSKNSTEPVNRDSIRQVYETLIKSKANLLPAAQIVEVGKIRPVDEGPSDTVFFVYREAMLQTIAQKNEFKLLEIVDDNVQVDVGGNRGIAAFVENWKLHTQKDSSALWAILKNVLEQGGAFSADRQRFTAPYYTATFPDAYDANTFGVITGEGVRVRAQPNLNSQILKTISYDVLPVLDWSGQPETIGNETHPWVKIKLNDGKEGYVYGKFIGSPLGYRAIFTRQPNGSWLMTAFNEGD